MFENLAIRGLPEGSSGACGNTRKRAFMVCPTIMRNFLQQINVNYAVGDMSVTCAFVSNLKQDS